MTVQEAKKHLENMFPKNQDKRRFIEECIDIAIKCMEEVEQYRSLGTVEELKEAREKQILKKPITYKDTNRADCPKCGNTVRGIKEPFGNYCSKCGQALKWGEE